MGSQIKGYKRSIAGMHRKEKLQRDVNEVINGNKEGMDEDGDEKMQNEMDNVEKPKSKKEMKRLAKLERRRMAKQRAKEEREKKMKKEEESRGDDEKSRMWILMISKIYRHRV